MSFSDEACCTCATLLSSIPPTYDEKTEKPLPSHERRLECCGRAICARCTTDNPRFQTYCPFCQISIAPSPLPQGLRDPPGYEEVADGTGKHKPDEQPPPYSESNGIHVMEEKSSPNAKPAGEDVLHFVDPNHDSISSLSLRYGVPTWALQRKNNLYAGHLLAARRTILIPGEFYKGGVSLSPRPPDGEEEERRKTTLRRFMTTCKIHDYDVAELYLKNAQYDLDLAIGVYQDDERWEKENPMNGQKGKSKIRNSPRRKMFGLASGLTGQLS
jgi:hypothetical protein